MELQEIREKLSLSDSIIEKSRTKSQRSCNDHTQYQISTKSGITEMTLKNSYTVLRKLMV